MSLVINSNPIQGMGGEPSNQMLTKYPDFDQILLRPVSNILTSPDGLLSTYPIAKEINGTPVNLGVEILDSQMRYKGTPNTASNVGNNSEIILKSDQGISRPANSSPSDTFTFWGRIGDLTHPFGGNAVVGGSMKRLLKLRPGFYYTAQLVPRLQNPSITITIEPKLLHSDGTLTTIFSKDFTISWTGDMHVTGSDSGTRYDSKEIVIVENGLSTANAVEGDLIVLDIKGKMDFIKHNTNASYSYSAYVAMKVHFGYEGSIYGSDQPKPFQLGISA